MQPTVYPHDLIGSLHLAFQRRYYDPFKIPRWKLELGKKINGQPYGLVPAFLKQHSPLDLVLQTIFE